MKQSNGPRQLHNLSSSSKVNWEKYRMKGYMHFDTPVSIEHMRKNITNPKWTASHTFKPFIHFELVFKKYGFDEDKGYKDSKDKTRKIFYASHKDQFIYKYYGDQLNFAYNEFVRTKSIDNVATAYRNNRNLSNIDFCYEVFEFIFNQTNALIISLDFSSFFDNIHHAYLKKNIKEVLGIKKDEELADDWYQVFKQTTRYSYIHQHDVHEMLKDKYGIKVFNSKKAKMKITPKEFRKLKKLKGVLKVNRKKYGIPQGSGMSAVCSNVYLIHFDQELKCWAEKYKALYRRYSDDLILVIPFDSNPFDFSRVKSELFQIVEKYKEYGLEVQEEKTAIRLYKNGEIINEKFNKSTLDYLGFVTDGEVVRMREKSLFKYYSRAYRKAKTSKRVSLATGRPGPKRELYDIYTHLGSKYKGYGNFISYAKKAHKKMQDLKTKSMINQQIKRHWSRIHRRLE